MNNDVERAQETGISRRTVAKAVAWSVPAIAVAATVPIAAASCVETTSFDNLRVGSRPSMLTFEPSGVTASLSYTASGGDSTPGDTGKVAATSTSPSWRYLELQLVEDLDGGDWVEMTIALSQPVTGLSFIIHDIDKSRSGGRVSWVDEVVVSPAGFTPQRGSNVVGNGTTSAPFTADAWGDTPISGGAGRVTLTWSNTVQQVTVRYRAGRDGRARSQHVGIGALRYDACLPPTQQARSIAPRSAPIPLDGDISVGEPPAALHDAHVDS
ncbi:hypothetical protein ACLD0U_02055 [Microbacterium sp. 2216-1]|uniref:hypothetical protein n=1 Tax=Microbacterium TaxID=33882 RepID=UPI001CD39E8F|nr:hypothetical protein [Microbacterium esteraromaticum]MCA1305515.1 hypothetical protein [Microbacterium esteraromaticum]